MNEGEGFESVFPPHIKIREVEKMKRFKHKNGKINYYNDAIAKRMASKKEGKIVKWVPPDWEDEDEDIVIEDSAKTDSKKAEDKQNVPNTTSSKG
jgi:hypothetical protein